MSEEIRIGVQWASKAKNDLLNADNNLRADEIPLDTVCFHCQQAAEKLLKAFLAARGQIPPRTHDLLLLLEQIVRESPSAEQLREDLAVLAPYAIEARYPDEGFAPSRQDAEEARQAAQHVLDWLVAAFPRLLGPCDANQTNLKAEP